MEVGPRSGLLYPCSTYKCTPLRVEVQRMAQLAQPHSSNVASRYGDARLRCMFLELYSIYVDNRYNRVD